MQPLSISLPLCDVFTVVFDGFVLIIVLITALPLKNLYLPDWFALRNTQLRTSRALFNPLMQK